jgi:hypothetical protein
MREMIAGRIKELVKGENARVRAQAADATEPA